MCGRRIYSITFSHTRNVGAALQEYALFQYCSLLGNDIEVIDYRSSILEKKNKIFQLNSKNIKQSIKSIILSPLNLLEKYKFYIFSKKHIKLTPRCKTAEDIKKLIQPDIYLAGSDQIWNVDITGFDKAFFLDFKTESLKAAYAASVGNDYLPQLQETEFLHLVKSFDYISVRERLLYEQLIKKGVANVINVLDPVFLLEKEDYSKIEKKPSYDKYVLIYEAEINDQCAKTAKQLAEKYHLKTVQMKRVNNHYAVDHVKPTVSPQEFIGLIHYAAFVVTNSFHATAFSLLFEKQFYYIKLQNRGSRIDNLIEIGELQNQVIEKKEDLLRAENRKIDYDRVNELFKEKRLQSKNFLNRILCGEQNK